jgi:hypothetical protein
VIRASAWVLAVLLISEFVWGVALLAIFAVSNLGSALTLH